MEKIEQDPLALFAYAIRAPGTKRHYTAKLGLFFDYAGLKGSLEEQARKFVSKALWNLAISTVMECLTYWILAQYSDSQMIMKTGIQW